MKINKAYLQLCSGLEEVYPPGEARSIARIVFEDAFGIRNFASEDELNEQQTTGLPAITSRLLKGEPVQYVMGKALFYGHYFRVGPGLLIPRPETEELVHWILEDHPGRPELDILDIGSGSGCIAIALKLNWPKARVSGLDVSTLAIETGRLNARQLKATVAFTNIDVLQKDQREEIPKTDLIVCNPPYIPLSEMELMPASVIRHEPPLALFVPDQDSLLFYRIVADLGRTKLKENGKIYFEINEHQAGEVVSLLQGAGYRSVVLKKDMQGKDRMVKAER